VLLIFDYLLCEGCLLHLGGLSELHLFYDLFDDSKEEYHDVDGYVDSQNAHEEPADLEPDPGLVDEVREQVGEVRKAEQ